MNSDSQLLYVCVSLEAEPYHLTLTTDSAIGLFKVRCAQQSYITAYD